MGKDRTVSKSEARSPLRGIVTIKAGKEEFHVHYKRLPQKVKSLIKTKSFKCHQTFPSANRRKSLRFSARLGVWRSSHRREKLPASKCTKRERPQVDVWVFCSISLDGHDLKAVKSYISYLGGGIRPNTSASGGQQPGQIQGGSQIQANAQGGTRTQGGTQIHRPPQIQDGLHIYSPIQTQGSAQIHHPPQIHGSPQIHSGFQNHGQTQTQGGTQIHRPSQIQGGSQIHGQTRNQGHAQTQGGAQTHRRPQVQGGTQIQSNTQSQGGGGQSQGIDRGNENEKDKRELLLLAKMWSLGGYLEDSGFQQYAYGRFFKLVRENYAKNPAGWDGNIMPISWTYKNTKKGSLLREYIARIYADYSVQTLDKCDIGGDERTEFVEYLARRQWEKINKSRQDTQRDGR